MVNWKEIRSYFPVVNNYVYLNPAGGAPMSVYAASEGKRFYDEMLIGGDIYWDEWLERKESVREKLAKFINASPDEMAFTLNTSHGMGQVASMLESQGDAITMKDEFPSSTYPWIHKKVNLQFVEPVNGIYRLEEIEKVITSNTRILISSYVQYNTGFRQDIVQLGKFCNERNLIFVLNATQGMGSMPIDVRKSQIDFLVFTGLKWTLAGYGIGGLFINKKWFGKINFPAAGWRSVTDSGLMNNKVLNLKNNASATEVGCPHFPNIFALGGALDLLNSIGQDNIFERIMELNKHLEKKIAEINLPVLSVLKREFRSGITLIKVNDAKSIVQKLLQKKIIVSARGEGLRVSVHIFNNFDDIDILTDELKKLVLH